MDRDKSSMIKPQKRPGMDTSVNKVKPGATERPLLTVTNLTSHSGRWVPSYGLPPISTKPGLWTGVEAGTSIPFGSETGP